MEEHRPAPSETAGWIVFHGGAPVATGNTRRAAISAARLAGYTRGVARPVDQAELGTAALTRPQEPV